MSSVARICLQNDDCIESVSVFLDGYPDSMGVELLKMNINQIENLMMVGSVRSIENGIIDGPRGVKCLTHRSIDGVINDDTQAYYFYLYNDGEWYFKTRNTKIFKLTDWLENELRNEVNI